MPWSSQYRSYLRTMTTREGTPHAFNVNEQCFIRKAHRCGKIFGASKSCFIACPTADELEPILELMSEKLTKFGIEPIIAVKERAYGQDIFCTKICGKIVESRFCIVILDDTVSGGTNIPNPNIYYEYGLMTSLRKHIVPLQKDALKLAFNIQSYDTIKYNAKNIASELDRAIKDAIKITEAQEQKSEETHFADRTVMRKLERAGLQVRDEQWFLWDVINDTGFQGFAEYEKGFYAYLGKVDSATEFQAYLEDLDVILYRTEKKADELNEQLEKAKEKESAIKKRIEDYKKVEKGAARSVSYLEQRELQQLQEATSKAKQITEWLDLMKTFYVGFIIDPQLHADEFRSKAQALVGQYKRYYLIFNEDDALEFGDLVVKLNPLGS